MRTHKKSRHHSNSSSSSRNKKQKHSHSHSNHHAQHDPTDVDATSTHQQHMTGWSQKDYQIALQNHPHQQQKQQLPSHSSSSFSSHSHSHANSHAHHNHQQQRVSRKKKRAQTPSWMKDPHEEEMNAAVSTTTTTMNVDSQESAAVTDNSSSSTPLTRTSSINSTLTSPIWNHLPRDCLLHIFSFYDFFQLTRWTCINHYWYSCLKRGLVARIVEQSWKMLRRRRMTSGPTTAVSIATAASSSTALAPLSTIISPLYDDPTAASMTDIPPHHSNPAAIITALDHLTSPSLSSLPPSAALKSITTLHLTNSSFPASAASSSASAVTPGTPYSSSSTLFKASLIHLNSLYLSQKNLLYSLHSNPLYQHLIFIYHMTWIQEVWLVKLRTLHCVLYRTRNQGKYPRDTKFEVSGGEKSESSNNGKSLSQTQSSYLQRQDSIMTEVMDNNSGNKKSPHFDLMPHHHLLDSCISHRSHILSLLHSSPLLKHLWTFLHGQPVRTVYGFTGESLGSVELENVVKETEKRMKERVEAEKKEKKGRYGASQSSSPPSSDTTLIQDTPAHYLTSSSRITPSPLTTSCSAHHISLQLKRMAELTRIWGVYLGMECESMLNQRRKRDDDDEKDEESMDGVQPSSTSSSSSSSSNTSPLLLAWVPISTSFLSHHSRLLHLQHFWLKMSEELGRRERLNVRREIEEVKGAEK